MIELTNDIVNDFAAASSREWIETNGIGGYSSSTVSGAHSRRYHGLLVAATKPPLGRMVLLSKFEETLIVGDERFEMSSNQYPGAVYPEGYKYLTGFCLDPFPVWTYEIEGIQIEKSIFMVHGEDSTVCRWEITNRSEIADLDYEIELRPLLAFRDHHYLRHEDRGFYSEFTVGKNVVSFTPYPEMPVLYRENNAVGIERAGQWYRNFEYDIERERGFDFAEDLFQPCSMRFDLSEIATVIASTVVRKIGDAERFAEKEIERRIELVAKAGTEDDLKGQLVLAADQFIVGRGEGKTIIAGYHWFSDWGRDTMIALPGLTLATNRPGIAKSILAEFSQHLSHGMLPNRFPDRGEEPEYNTVDATLWFFEAIRAYAEATDDYDFIRDALYEKLANIIEWHVRGTRYRIHVDSDGLLYAGEPGVQLTWMDAKIGDWVVTPRTGKPVEIQALWYNALCIMNDLATRFHDARRQPHYFEMAEIAQDSFIGQFWNPQEKCLYDVINGAEKDASIRPNQIFAVSLRHTLLDEAQARAVVDKVEAELLTPYGLRSLSPRDPAYAPIYTGSPLQRDASYHQGTVWGWLLGPFVEAYRKTHSKDETAAKRIREIIGCFEMHFSDAMVSQISEIFDADGPHAARGCAAQAWSVAELLRVSR